MKLTLYAYISEWQMEYIKREHLGTEKLFDNVSWSTSKPLRAVAHLGQVDVEIDLIPPDQVLSSVAEMLQQKIVEIRAKATKETTELEGKIQQLLAIEHREAP